MNTLTHHMVDDEKIETIEAWRTAKQQPVKSSRQALEDAAIDLYIMVHESQGPEAAVKAWENFWNNNNKSKNNGFSGIPIAH